MKTCNIIIDMFLNYYKPINKSIIYCGICLTQFDNNLFNVTQ